MSIQATGHRKTPTPGGEGSSTIAGLAHTWATWSGPTSCRLRARRCTLGGTRPMADVDQWTVVDSVSSSCPHNRMPSLLLLAEGECAVVPGRIHDVNLG